ncbi:MAG TPA: DUF1801 domain-containing protein [Nitrososphaerales archaeon]|nr:DUF1801 domain-containing protein [Nitrososphaerales archaeon]
MDQGEQAVEAYIRAADEDARKKLTEVRRAIREVAPAATERISYGMPYYEYEGRLAWFGLQRNHIGLYLRPPVVQDHQKELEGYVTTKSAVHFPLSGDIDLSLVKKLVRARMKMNEAEARRRRR